MCLITEQKLALKAKEDITVYKTVLKLHIDNQTTVISILQGFVYELNKIYKTDLTINPKKEKFWFADLETQRHYINHINLNKISNHLKTTSKAKVINKGFHAYLSLNRTSKYLRFQKVECTIPKGSYYYKDATGLIVSNQIIINKIL